MLQAFEPASQSALAGRVHSGMPIRTMDGRPGLPTGGPYPNAGQARPMAQQAFAPHAAGQGPPRPLGTMQAGVWALPRLRRLGQAAWRRGL